MAEWEKWRRAGSRLLPELVALGFGLAVGMTVALILPAPAVKYDAVEYQSLGASLAQGAGFTYSPDRPPTAFRPPLYPLFLASVFALAGAASPAAAYVAQAVLLALTAALVVALARRLMPAPAALAAGLLAALTPGLAGWVGFLYVEMLLTFLVTLAALALLNLALLPSAGRGALAGGLWGLAVLCKGAAAALPVLALPVMVTLAVWSPPWRRSVLAFAAALALVLAPWTLRNLALFGSPVVSSTNIGVQLYIATLDPITFDSQDPRLSSVAEEAATLALNEAELDRLYLQKGIRWMQEYPWGFVQRIVRNSVQLWQEPSEDWVGYIKPTAYWNDLPEVAFARRLHLVLVTLGLVGAAAALARRDTPALWLALIPLAFTIIYAPTFVRNRFMLPAMPVVIVLGMHFLAMLPAAVPIGMRWWRLGATVTAMTLLGAAALVFRLAFVPQFLLAVPAPGAAATGVWTVHNPDDEAPFTRVHFARVAMAEGDYLTLAGADGTVYQKLADRSSLAEGWSVDIPGAAVLVRLQGSGAAAASSFAVDAAGSGDGQTLEALPGGVVRLTASAIPDGSTVRVRLRAALSQEGQGDVGIDIYGIGPDAGRPHYGWWAVPLEGSGADALLLLDLVTQQGDFHAGGHGAPPAKFQVWPAGDGAYQAYAQMKIGERFFSAPLFAFVLRGGAVEGFHSRAIQRLFPVQAPGE